MNPVSSYSSELYIPGFSTRGFRGAARPPFFPYRPAFFLPPPLKIRRPSIFFRRVTYQIIVYTVAQTPLPTRHPEICQSALKEHLYTASDATGNSIRLLYHVLGCTTCAMHGACSAAGAACVVFSLSARRFTLDFVRVGQLTVLNKLRARVYTQIV